MFATTYACKWKPPSPGQSRCCTELFPLTYLKAMPPSLLCTIPSISLPTILQTVQSFALIGSLQRFCLRYRLRFLPIRTPRRPVPPPQSPPSRSAIGADRVTPGRDQPLGQPPTLLRSSLPPILQTGRPPRLASPHLPTAAEQIHCATVPRTHPPRAPSPKKARSLLPPVRKAAVTAGQRP